MRLTLSNNAFASFSSFEFISSLSASEDVDDNESRHGFGYPEFRSRGLGFVECTPNNRPPRLLPRMDTEGLNAVDTVNIYKHRHIANAAIFSNGQQILITSEHNLVFHF
mmetsp:Transcript_4008/g.4659  ORF Transcript_4008/g.4659 Transcript_4008/m.4659 type:complete len:109 (+) Transcript_4008:730-1056(+)